MGESNANPFAAYDLAVLMRECIEPFLAGTTSGMPDRSCVTSGEIAWDDCECGQLVVSIVDGFEAGNNFEESATSATAGRRACGPPKFVFSYLVSMLRCAPGMGENGEPPSCDELDAAARVAVEDAWAVRAGIVCCLTSAVKDRLPNGTKHIVDFTIGTQTFVGPNGFCQGSDVPVTITIQNGCYPCDVS